MPTATAAAMAADADRVLMETLGRADRAAMAALPAWRRTGLVRVACAVSDLAEPAVVGPVLTAVVLVAARRGGWRAAIVPAAVPAALAARRRLAAVIARSRPPEDLWLTEPEGFSLPSRHTTTAALTAGACAAALGVRAGRRRGVTVLAAAGVGASRVYLGVHWPTDVLAGWLFAEAWITAAAGLAGWLTGWQTGAGQAAVSPCSSAG